MTSRRRHDSADEDGGGQRRRHSPEHCAQSRGGDDRKGRMGQQNGVYSIRGRRNYRPGERVAFPLSLLQERRRWGRGLLVAFFYFWCLTLLKETYDAFETKRHEQKSLFNHVSIFNVGLPPHQVLSSSRISFSCLLAASPFSSWRRRWDNIPAKAASPPGGRFALCLKVTTQSSQSECQH